jgi:hypothetical protein
VDLMEINKVKIKNKIKYGMTTEIMCMPYTIQLTARLTHKCSCAFSWRRIPRTSTPSGSWSKSNSMTCTKVYPECNIK